MFSFLLFGLLLTTILHLTWHYPRQSEPRIVLSRSQCGRLEYYNDCGSKCSPACLRTRFDCDECASGCFCKRPFLRSFPGGPCARICPVHMFKPGHQKRPNQLRPG
ncbi:hypothetical protein ILUMI_24688 [Ignelater luminosus]|uniref:TIL domain-containing protein n=1 Tax=Ignelater luminosus TaxID=2038154 RepID=A0A8K0FWH8_IGNLU|nr:hypothetical protein ILUMI_24688 [Ignelater luminosus]